PDNPMTEVIGLVGDTREVSLHRSPYLMVYRPYWSDGPPQSASLVLKTGVYVASLAPAIRRAIHDVDPEVPAPRLTTFEETIDHAVAPDRFQLTLVELF